MRESSSEKERDAKFPVPPVAFSPAQSSRRHRGRRDVAAATTHLGEAASTPGSEAPRPAPRGARAPWLGHASFPARDRRELSPRLLRIRQMVASDVHAGRALSGLFSYIHGI